MKELITSICFLGFISICLSQQITTSNTSSLESVHKVVLEPLDNNLLRSEHSSQKVTPAPLRFAVSRAVDLNPENAGNWEYTKNDQAIWRLIVKSPAALSLNLGFTRFSLPEKGTLYLYSPDRRTVFGPFKPDKVKDALWSPIIPGDEIVIEVNVSQGQEKMSEVQLGYINHDFIGIGNVMRSGSCNLDVVCGEADGWEMVDAYRDIIRSVGMYSIEGVELCTGALINNTLEDGTPYFLTANHCGIRNGNDQTVVIYWNYENDVCRQPNSPSSGAPGNGSLTQFNSGVVLRANYGPTDFALVETVDPVVVADAFLSGWNRSAAIPQNAVCIHHPNTDEKRISFEFDPLVRDGTDLRVNDWDVGTTEGGSSGAPLYNDEKQIVGQLFGGFAACGNNEWDAYGWLNISWEGGGSANNRLKDWLDPLNSGIESLGGLQTGYPLILSETEATVCAPDTVEITVAISANFIAAAEISTDSLPAGVTTLIENQMLDPGDTTAISILIDTQAQTGKYQIVIIAEDGTNEGITVFELEIFDSIPGAPTLINPANNTENANVFSFFEWEEKNNSTYEIQIALDSLFAEIVFFETEAMSGIQSTALEEEQMFYWRVRGHNECGYGEWSEIFSFSTSTLICERLSSTNVPLVIGAGQPNTVESKLIVPLDGEILDLNVIDVAGTHNWVGDLTFLLRSPTGKVITLISEACDDAQNFSITFDDEADGPPPCPFTDSGVYTPLESLSVFNGDNARGIWRLIVQDGADQDGGSFNSWGLEFCLKGATDYSVTANPANRTICPQDTAVFELDLGVSFDTASEVMAIMLPPGVNMTVNQGQGNSRIVSLSGFEMLDAGTYSFTFVVDDGSGMNEINVEVVLLSFPDTPDLLNPPDASTNIVLEPTLKWQVGNTTDSVLVEVGGSPDFSVIIYSGIVTTDSLALAVTLDELSVYYWRVTAFNNCGTTTSSIFSFTTEESLGVLSIPPESLKVYPNPAGNHIAVSITGQTILDVVVTGVNGDHYAGISKTSPGLAYIALPSVATGIYWVKVITENGYITRKIIIMQ